MNDISIRQMAVAVRHWLKFQILCGREMLLSEAYLAQPIGEFLRSHHSGNIKSEWNHPNIQSPGRGRPRQIDYALLSRDNDRPIAAIEAKWIADAQASKQRLLDDVLRLECLRDKSKQSIDRYFLLAGRCQNIQRNCLDLRTNIGNGRDTFVGKILPLNRERTPIPVRQCEEPLRTFFKSFSDSYKVGLPTSYSVQLVEDEGGNGDETSRGEEDIRVIVWRIVSSRKRSEFLPLNVWGKLQVPETETDD